MSNEKNVNTQKLEITFSTLVISIGSSALMALGEIPLDENGKKEVNLDMAQLNIGLLTLLKEKTKNNLKQEEENFLNSMINNLQLKFLEVKK